MTKIINRFTSNLICEEALLNIRKTAEKNKADLRGADLRGADLREADLGGANLGGADLRGADLREADLRGADLGGANLGGADLRGADLREANLGGANLGGANLGGADLWGADLRGANLRGANLWGVKIADKKIVNYKEVSGIGNSRRQLHCFLLENGSFYFMAGCFSGSEEELLAAVAKKYGNDCEYIDAINFLKQISIKCPWE